jgi:hypothetical protein
VGLHSDHPTQGRRVQPLISAPDLGIATQVNVYERAPFVGPHAAPHCLPGRSLGEMGMKGLRQAQRGYRANKVQKKKPEFSAPAG